MQQPLLRSCIIRGTITKMETQQQPSYAGALPRPFRKALVRDDVAAVIGIDVVLPHPHLVIDSDTAHGASGSG